MNFTHLMLRGVTFPRVVYVWWSGICHVVTIRPQSSVTQDMSIFVSLPSMLKVHHAIYYSHKITKSRFLFHCYAMV